MASVGGPGSPTATTSSWDWFIQDHPPRPQRNTKRRAWSLQLQRGETWAEGEPLLLPPFPLELRNDAEEWSWEEIVVASVGGRGSPTAATSSWDGSSRITHQGHNAIPSREHGAYNGRGERHGQRAAV